MPPLFCACTCDRACPRAPWQFRLCRPSSATCLERVLLAHPGRHRQPRLPSAPRQNIRWAKLYAAEQLGHTNPEWPHGHGDTSSMAAGISGLQRQIRPLEGLQVRYKPERSHMGPQARISAMTLPASSVAACCRICGRYCVCSCLAGPSRPWKVSRSSSVLILRPPA